MNETFKLFNEVKSYDSAISDKFVTFFDDVKKHIDGVFFENQSPQDTNILLIRLLSVTLQNIFDSVRVPVNNLNLAADRIDDLIPKLDQLSSKITASISTELKGIVEKVFEKLDELRKHLPVTPSTAEGAPRGGKVPDFGDDEDDNDDDDDADEDDVDDNDDNDEEKSEEREGDETFGAKFAEDLENEIKAEAATTEE
ncbi:hypothetical protein L2E82_30479 [Cichorium intybus]|uniref:Uncharacterized protein n=1 Tax=Cichorium intybus TaxID=13427 RepID=A0ACB9D0D5_CICIN|nr:hypothetical protein L2E82_30479 [Cichorium intybus]